MIRSGHVKGHQPRVCIRTMCLPQLLYVSVLHKSEIINYIDKTNNTYISIEIITYKLLCHLWIIPMHRHTNVEEMGINPVLAFYNIESNIINKCICNTLIFQKKNNIL
jgi:hypothetical protein